jgi:hypothetical protein
MYNFIEITGSKLSFEKLLVWARFFKNGGGGNGRK